MLLRIQPLSMSKSQPQLPVECDSPAQGHLRWTVAVNAKVILKPHYQFLPLSEDSVY